MSEQDLEHLVQVVRTGSEEEARDAIRQVVLNYRDGAIPRIVREIDTEELVGRDGARVLKYSPRWNDLGLKYLARDRISALEIFLHMSRREVKSPASFNNLGCAIVMLGLPDQAKPWFQRAWAQDIKAFGLDGAAKHPAFRNLQLLDKIRKGITASFSVQTPAVPPGGPGLTKQASLGLTRLQIRASLWTDFLIGGIGAGLLLVLMTGAFSYIDSYAKGSGYILAVIGLVILVIAITWRYQRLPAEGSTSEDSTEVHPESASAVAIVSNAKRSALTCGFTRD
jgi:hypothetical protein